MGNSRSKCPKKEITVPANSQGVEEKEEETEIKDIYETVETYYEEDELFQCDDQSYVSISEDEGFIFVKDLILENLPDPIKHQAILRYIQVQEKLTVRITSISDETRRCFGTGYAWLAGDDPVVYDVCPANQCCMKGQPHKAYGGLIVYTNHHVVKDDDEAQQSTIDFFYNVPDQGKLVKKTGDTSENIVAGSERAQTITSDIKPNDAQILKADVETLPKITAYGFCLRENRENKDLVCIRLIFHEPELFDIVRKFNDIKLTTWAAVPDDIKTEMKNHAIVISHPRGFHKTVSFGKLICHEEYDDSHHATHRRKVTKYKAATTNGSSGAPVLTGHYAYRPFAHSSKWRKKNGDELLWNVSYSY